MIKVYFDWNVFAQIKNGKHIELRTIVFNDKRLFIPYSMSHINDIFSSYNKNIGITDDIDSDLHYLSKITCNRYLFNNGVSIDLAYCQPNELFQNKINTSFAGENCYADVGKIFSDLVDPICSDILKGIKLDLGAAFENAECAKLLDTVLPGLRDNQTFGGIVDGFCKYFNSCSNGEGYKNLRQILQSTISINRDKIFNSDDPYQQIEAFYKKLNVDFSEYLKEVLNYKSTPDWFSNIVIEYSILDMHGYQEDRINIQKGRKETAKNMIDDALHAAFASTCNFYVTNDKKAYKKTKMIYQKMQKDTMVLKPDEFVSYYNEFLKSEDMRPSGDYWS